MPTTPSTSTIDVSLFDNIEQRLNACADPLELTEIAGDLTTAARSMEGTTSENLCGHLHNLSSLLHFAAEASTVARNDAGHVDEDVALYVLAHVQIIRGMVASPDNGNADTVATLVDDFADCWGDRLSLFGSDWFADVAASEHSAESDGAIDTSASRENLELILSLVDAPSVEEQSVVADSPRVGSGFEAQSAKETNSAAGAPDIDDELFEAYREDATNCLASMERAVLEFESNPDATSPAKQICRDLHTLKGASASIGLTDLAARLHEVEEQLQTDSGSGSEDQTNAVINCIDAVRQTIAERRGATDASSSRLDQTPAFSADSSGEGSDGDTLRVKTAQLDRLMNLLADIVLWRRHRDERVHELDAADDEIAACLYRLEGMTAGSTSSTEIVSDLREIGQKLRGCREGLAEENRAVSQFILAFRQELVHIRRVPLTGLFQRLHRVARDAGQIEGKQVKFAMIGQHTGLERSLQERLYEPLLHLIRNAVGHGIESPADRRTVGKAAVGTVTIEAYGSPHVLVIEIRDDGQGLNYDAIRRRGFERGLLRADRPASEAELARLIFQPGFSTRREANQLAGRGVGLDVVATALQRCNCHIETESRPGQGTTFRLTMPLRSVIEHMLVFRSRGQAYGVPMEVVSAANPEGTTGHNNSDPADLQSVLGNRGPRQSRPVHSLRLSLPTATTSVSGTSLSPAAVEIGVDEILGPEEVVVRPLPPLLRNHPHVCGATLSGMGDVVLLLDARQLAVDAARHQPSSEMTLDAETPSDTPGTRPRVLVVDDSLTARRRMSHILSREGVDIVEATDGREALRQLKERSFDAVFSDLEMPHMDGFELLQAVGSETTKPPWVMITSVDNPKTRQRAEKLGADHFLAKAADNEAIVNVIRGLRQDTHSTSSGAN